MELPQRLERSLTRLHGSVQTIGTGPLREELEAGIGEVVSQLEDLVAAHRELEERNGRLLHLSQSDEVTGLHNQRHFMQRLDEEFRRARRYGTPLALLLADLDDFKVFNDARGHLAGDGLLREVARVIRGGARATDLAARCGGDEFAVLLPQTDQEQARALAERLRRDVLAMAERMSVSIGVAALGPDTTGPLDLLTEADRAMYRAKAQGRSRVRTASLA